MTEDQNNLNAPPKKKRGKIITILILIIILLLTAIVFWWFFRDKGFSGELSPASDVKAEQENGIAAIISSAGGVLTTQGADGTVYSLTVPPDAVILPTLVTLVPVKDMPIENYGSSKVGSGVYVGPKRDEGMTFIRPAYLSIQPNMQKLSLEQLGQTKWGRCNIGSLGFEPEICAGEKGLPFGLGIEPGKVVVYSKSNNNKKLDNVYLSPTIPIGEENTFITPIWSTGAYTADRINKKQLESFFAPTFHGASDYVNKVELLSHWSALGGDLTPYKSEIESMSRDKKDYPRMVLETAIVASAANDKKSTQKRLDDLKVTIERNINRARGSFMEIPYYVGFLKQIDVSQEKISSSFPKNIAQDLNNINPPGLLESAIAKAKETFEDKNSWAEEATDALESIMIARSSSGSASIGTTQSALTSPKDNPDGGTNGDQQGDKKPVPISPTGDPDRDKICVEKVKYCENLEDVLPKCKTMKCCNQAFNYSLLCGCSTALGASQKCSQDLDKKMEDCRGLLIKKDLKTFGQNQCKTVGIKAPMDYIRDSKFPDLTNDQWNQLNPLAPLPQK